MKTTRAVAVGCGCQNYSWPWAALQTLEEFIMSGWEIIFPIVTDTQGDIFSLSRNKFFWALNRLLQDIQKNMYNKEDLSITTYTQNRPWFHHTGLKCYWYWMTSQARNICQQHFFMQMKEPTKPSQNPPLLVMNSRPQMYSCSITFGD